MENPRILVLGGTGFVGSHVVQTLADNGLIIARVVRKKSTSQKNILDFVGDITDIDSLRDAFKEFKPDIVINLVGIIKEEPPKITFERIVVHGTSNTITLSKEFGVNRIIYVSAIGADLNGATEYFRTKAIAENILSGSGIDSIIFRPSLIFGQNAGFTNQFVRLLKILPFAPIIGNGGYKFMPVSIESLAKCIRLASLKTFTNDSNFKVYDLVGPETLTLLEIIERLKTKLSIQRINIFIPFWLMKIVARFGDLVLLSKLIPINSDQLVMLKLGSVGDSSKLKEDFDVEEIYFDPKGKTLLY